MNTIQSLAKRAVALQSEGNTAEAINLFHQVLTIDSRHAVALYSLAAININNANAPKAVEYAERCYKSNSVSALSLFIYGSALRLAGRRFEAIGYLQKACTIDITHVNAHLILGVAYAETGQQEKALASFERVLALEPSHISAKSNIAAIAPYVREKIENENRKLQDALDLQAIGQVDEAYNIYSEILANNPKQYVALYSSAVISLNTGKADRALGFAERCKQADSSSASSWYIYAAALKASRKYGEALYSVNKALAIAPAHVESFIIKAHIYGEQKQYALALDQFNKVLELDPRHTQALNNAATLLTILNRYSEAVELYKRLLTVRPDFEFALGALSHSRMHCCDWTDYEKLKNQILESVREGKKACKQMPFLAISDSSEDQLKCSKIFADFSYPRNSLQLSDGKPYNHKRIRLGYISPDLRQHPVGHVFAGAMENHNKKDFEIYAFSLGIDDSSSLRKRFMKAADRFIDVRGKSSLEIAQTIRDAEIDVLIDLAGATMDAQPDVLAYKPAPIQILYLGYPGTSGAEYMDYILADRTVIPEEHKSFYTEKVLYLPNCYLPADPEVDFSKSAPSREAMGLPKEGFVFCSFNHDYKINPPVFAAWMNILSRVENSVLWLMKLNNSAEENLRKEAELRGISAKRLVFAERISMISDHVARYKIAGLFLDTTPYNAHTTATDALRAGLPVLTIEGNSFQSRVAASILKTVDMEELVAQNLSEYEEKAVALATKENELEELKNRLAINVAKSSLTDAAQFAAGIEKAVLEAIEEKTL
jgi:predicted O-linked N-acetylglucosamine transferase (SPINDLY family)